MALKAPKDNGKNFTPQDNLEPGTYKARLVQLIDLGLQPQRPYQGQEKKPAYEIMLTYELVDEFMKDDNGDDIEDKPRWVSETFALHPLTNDKAKSTKRYEAFDKEHEFDGDFTKCIGAPILVTIVNNKVGDKVYDNVANLAAMRAKDAVACPPLVNPTKMFDLSSPDMEVFNNIPQWLQDKIKGNLEFAGSPLSAKLGGDKAPPAKKEAKVKPPVEDDNNDDEGNNPY
jgi:hypothetical protein